MRLSPLLAVMPLTLAMHAQAADTSIDLNDDVAHLEISAQPNPKALRFGAGVFHHEGSADLAIARVSAGDRMSNFRDIEFNLGGAAGHLRGDDDTDGSFIALSALAKYHVPDAVGVTFSVGADYAPDVVSSADLDGYFALTAEGAYRIVPTGQLFGGYRHIKLNLAHTNNVSFDEGLYAGFRFFY